MGHKRKYGDDDAVADSSAANDMESVRAVEYRDFGKSLGVENVNTNAT